MRFTLSIATIFVCLSLILNWFNLITQKPKEVKKVTPAQIDISVEPIGMIRKNEYLINQEAQKYVQKAGENYPSEKNENQSYEPVQIDIPVDPIGIVRKNPYLVNQVDQENVQKVEDNKPSQKNNNQSNQPAQIDVNDNKNVGARGEGDGSRFWLYVGNSKYFKNFKFVGNSASLIFHLITCKDADRIKKGNMVKFESREQAIKKGFHPCSHCCP